MILQNMCVIVALLIGSSPSSGGIVDRAETTKMRLSNGTTRDRVVRDGDGQVTILNLSGMSLSRDDFKELGQLERLRALVLVRTNATDDDLSHLKQCKHLEHLNLTSTEVTDRAIDTIVELKSLKSLCLGNVRITQQAVEKLTEQYRERAHGNRLSVGYFQRHSQGQ